MAPISVDRLLGYLEKATKEAKLRTSWTDPHEQYGNEVSAFARGVLADAELVESIGAFVARPADLVAASVLAQKLITLTMPGVPDTYQGTEVVNRSLVDPDNRREVDYQRRADLLSQLEGGSRLDSLDARKLLVTSTALRLRRDNPHWFVGPDATYTPLATTTSHLVAFARGTREGGAAAISLATRLPATLERLGGWADNTVALPPGQWRDLLSGRDVAGGTAVIAQILTDLPVALLIRADAA
jgi:(1->4)-alpha-D-glucan 1-alpha-D-glucosylmutase